MKNLIILLIITICLNGCLTVENKQYTYKIKPDGSGSASILFIGISSADEDSTDKSLKDYGELIDDYYNGSKFENEHPEWINVKKSLKVENNKLVGEITFDFNSPEAVGLYRYKEKGNWMYYVGNFGMFNQEKLDTIDLNSRKEITYGGEKMPVLFWGEKQSSITFKTIATDKERSYKSLLPLYKKIGDKKNRK